MAASTTRKGRSRSRAWCASQRQRGRAARQGLDRYDLQYLPVLPVATRFDPADSEQHGRWQGVLAQRLAPLFEQWPEAAPTAELVSRLQLPHHPSLSYGEGPQQPQGLRLYLSLPGEGLRDLPEHEALPWTEGDPLPTLVAALGLRSPTPSVDPVAAWKARAVLADVFVELDLDLERGERAEPLRGPLSLESLIKDQAPRGSGRTTRKPW